MILAILKKIKTLNNTVYTGICVTGYQRHISGHIRLLTETTTEIITKTKQAFIDRILAPAPGATF